LSDSVAFLFFLLVVRRQLQVEGLTSSSTCQQSFLRLVTC
jgi:hypothetical protein